MQIGTWLLIKHENIIKKGRVIKIYPEDLDIQLENGNIVRRKYWEVRTAPFDNPKEE
jgi:hypothetical protein